jgi:hypothetical protein
MDASQAKQIKRAAPVWVWDGYWDNVAHGPLGEKLPLNVVTVAPTASESPRDQGNSSGRRKF